MERKILSLEEKNKKDQENFNLIYKENEEKLNKKIYELITVNNILMENEKIYKKDITELIMENLILNVENKSEEKGKKVKKKLKYFKLKIKL